MCLKSRFAVLCLCLALCAMPIMLTGCSNDNADPASSDTAATQASDTEQEQDNCYGDDLPALNQ